VVKDYSFQTGSVIVHNRKYSMGKRNGIHLYEAEVEQVIFTRTLRPGDAISYKSAAGSGSITMNVTSLQGHTPIVEISARGSFDIPKVQRIGRLVGSQVPDDEERHVTPESGSLVEGAWPIVKLPSGRNTVLPSMDYRINCQSSPASPSVLR
jgi:hypothetical protein